MDLRELFYMEKAEIERRAFHDVAKIVVLVISAVLAIAFVIARSGGAQ